MPDGLSAPVYAASLSQLKAPFLSAYFTLSTHAPYDIPDRERYHSEGPEADYLRTAMYADAAIGDFFARVKKEPWYQDTLFVLVADHSHATYRPLQNWEPDYRRIPMLLLGGALKEKFRGKSWSRVGSQVDISKTLLNQLGWESGAYSWGHDLFDLSTPAFAYYETNRGAGWIAEEGQLVFDRELNTASFSTFPEHKKSQALKRAQAYVQSVVDFYIKARPPASAALQDESLGH